MRLCKDLSLLVGIKYHTYNLCTRWFLRSAVTCECHSLIDGIGVAETGGKLFDRLAGGGRPSNVINSLASSLVV